MIRNPSKAHPSLPNKHALYIGLTGSGKSQALKAKSGIPQKGARLVLFDPSKDHAKGVTYYDDRAQFARALAKANASGRGFRIGYSGVRSVDIHEWFCQCVHAILNCNKLTYVICEELGRVSKSSNKTTPYHEWLINEGRKYGLIYHCTTQFPARISKDVYDNAEVIFFGKQPARLHKQFCQQFGLNLEELRSLGALEFLRWQGEESKKIKISYQK